MKGDRRRMDRWEWVFLVALVLAAWALRLCCLHTVPPGWRDDELINIHALSGRLLAGEFPLYYTGASGHEPLYHHLHAAVHAVLGFNVLSGHILSVALGTLTVALTYVLARRLFGRPAAVVASVALSTSFWSLMYSRIGLRHIILPPLALLVFYLTWLPLADRSRKAVRWVVPLGISLALTTYTYPASRMLPVLLVVFALYLSLFHRDLFRRVWRGYGIALLLTAVLIIPLAWAISQGTSEAAASGIGADARIVELARPLWALLEGDPGPLLETARGTLNMFHATGDPEWLYNIPARPVFGMPGAILFWAGAAISIVHWRKPRYAFLILWFSFGLVPTVLSVPPASLSHSILIQPLVYIIAALPFVEGGRWLRNRVSGRRRYLLRLIPALIALALFLVPNAYRDLQDYFFRWPQESMVRFLYRADYRDAVEYIDTQRGEDHWAISSLLMGPWDRLAVEVDLSREDMATGLFNPERAFLYAGCESPAAVILTSYPPPALVVDHFLSEGQIDAPVDLGALTRHNLAPPSIFDREDGAGRFANGLELVDVAWFGEVSSSDEATLSLLTFWRVGDAYEPPPVSIVANPPPPGVWSGPRLAVFTHVVAGDGAFLAGDDGLWVDPATLYPGDCFFQAHQFTLAQDVLSAPHAVEIGLYDPMDGVRLGAVDGAGRVVSDHLLISGGQISSWRDQ
jgi:4-amino-4-deoxy-L-arabinose transferase-like glycosyltransferase